MDTIEIEKKKTSTGFLLVKIVAIWIFIIGVGLIAHHFLTNAEKKEMEASRQELATKMDQIESENESFLSENLPNCHRILENLIAAAPEDSSAYIYANPTELAAIEDFVGSESFEKLVPEKLERINQKLLTVDGEKAILTRWEQQGLEPFDVLFRNTQSGWKVDGSHLAAVSDISWEELIAGEGIFDGSFRVLAKLHYPQEEDQREGRMYVAIFPPNFGGAISVPEEPIVLELDPELEEGVLFSSEFAAVEAENPLSIFPGSDSGIIRVNLHLNRQRVADYRKIELREVRAPHWFTLQEQVSESVTEAED